MADDIRIDEDALKRLVGEADGTRELLQEAVDRSVSNANADSAGFRTEVYRRPGGETVGDTQPEYGGSVQMGRVGYVGIVHPRNYSAMKDDHLHNTMLKALR